MSPWYWVLLAILQGLTEFLPISSSAHLILLPHVLDVPDQGLVFDVAANTGTLLAVVVYFRSELLRLAAGLGPSGAPGGRLEGERRLALSLALASLPVLALGFLMRDLVATLARNPVLIATTSIVFGVLLWAVDRWRGGEREVGGATRADALWIGCGQALALIPGVSRSGITITAGLWRRFSREEAARYSFLLAVPVSVAAAGYESLGLLGTQLTGRVLAELALVVAVSAVT
ncbi:MAG: undecaprenyl-diphosphate phosphatase, partial [Thermoanaerobaculia bacterium]|nr:undecaprenyl-diphosphate phosphatase [Thermoanaerobaculia bacterium]